MGDGRLLEGVAAWPVGSGREWERVGGGREGEGGSGRGFLTSSGSKQSAGARGELWVGVAYWNRLKAGFGGGGARSVGGVGSYIPTGGRRAPEEESRRDESGRVGRAESDGGRWKEKSGEGITGVEGAVRSGRLGWVARSREGTCGVGGGAARWAAGEGPAKERSTGVVGSAYTGRSAGGGK